jgi:hypothetical protein
MTLPSKNAYLSRAARRAAKWDKTQAEEPPRLKTYDIVVNGAQLAKYRKRITLAKVSIQQNGLMDTKSGDTEIFSEDNDHD